MPGNINIFIICLKGWFTTFLLCMIVFMGRNITCIRGFSYFKSPIFHKLHLYFQPRSPLSPERAVHFLIL